MNNFEQIEILLVEDNAADAEMAMRALKKGGLANSLLWVKDGQQALDYLFQKGEYAGRPRQQPKLVLLDLKMPRVDGIEVLREMRSAEATRRVPVVIMTSSQEESDLTRSYDLGVNSYVVKPVDFTAMTEVVRQAGYYWLAINQVPPR